MRDAGGEPGSGMEVSPVPSLTIAYCSAWFFQEVTIPLVNALSNRHAIHLFMALGDPADPQATGMRTQIARGVHAVFLSRRGRMRNPGHMWHDWLLLRHILCVKPDAIVVESIVSPYFVPYWHLLRWMGYPIFYAVHDVIPHGGSEHAIEDFLQAHRIRTANVVAVFSEDQAQVMKKRFNRIPIVLGLPFREARDISAPIESIAREPRTVLFFGVIRHNKGLDVLIEGAERARDRIPGLKVVVAGALECDPSVLDGVRNASLFEFHLRRTTLLERARFFQRASCAVLPYRDATQSGIPAIAYAYGCPVIATRVGAIPEWVDEGTTGMLIEPNDPDALAEALVKFFESDATIRAMQEAGALFARNRFNPVEIARRVSETLVRVVAHRR
jgi:glycosyltransferase involved in cell wall biosynthesis